MSIKQQYFEKSYVAVQITTNLDTIMIVPRFTTPPTK